ncbi:hypothetical protein FC38_GL000267 [Lactobacillus gigeriorum DSM 23908 = CRBIP 24.85]|uniref:Uncharacterized protein n=1 Tax=Lactobacillus gigeriorum DSM 23908 = CRBIP 24.85 TaxID=1423751 RepID=A0ABR5PVF2_9LACO|nr:hypothetical protein FC38_GL000267 [Lactobacillus gigeriorum DSM 23908 = CRBIP 24.85]
MFPTCLSFCLFLLSLFVSSSDLNRCNYYRFLTNTQISPLFWCPVVFLQYIVIYCKVTY